MMCCRRLPPWALVGLLGLGCTSRLDISGAQDSEGTDATGSVDVEGDGADGADTADGAEAGDGYGDDWTGPSCSYAYLDICTEPGPNEYCGNGEIDADEACDDDDAFGTFDGCTRSCRRGPLLVGSHRAVFPAAQRMVSTGLELSHDGQSFFDGVQLEPPSPNAPGFTWQSSLDGALGGVVATMPLRDRFDEGSLYLATERPEGAARQRVSYWLDVGAAGGSGQFEMPAPLRVPERCLLRAGGVDLRVGRFTDEAAGGATIEFTGVVGFEVGPDHNGQAHVEQLFEPDPNAPSPSIDCARLSTGELAYTWFAQDRYHLRTQSNASFAGTEIQANPISPADAIAPSIIALPQGRAAWLEVAGGEPVLRVGDPKTAANASSPLPANGVDWESLDHMGDALFAVRGRDFAADEAVWQVYDAQGNEQFELRRGAASNTSLFDALLVGDDTIAWLVDAELIITDRTGYSAWSVDLPPELGLDTLWALPDGRVVVLGAAGDHLSMALAVPESREHDFEVHEFETGAQVSLARVLQTDEDHVALAAVSTLANGDTAYEVSVVRMD